MPDSGVTINIRTRGGRQSAREARMAASGIGAIGRAAASTSRELASLGGSATSRAIGGIAQQAKYAGFAVGGLGIIAGKTGIAFNASMEQNEIAFKGLLGSTAAARRELDFLYATAAKTPFEVPQITSAARKFLAFGFSVKEANSLLLTTGDAIAGAGLGADSIERVVLALGQIRGKGRLQSEELLQLQELGLIDPSKLAKRLGITTEQLANVGEESISSGRAIKAIQATLDDTFGGQAAKQAESFNGQMSSLKDNLNQTLGEITKPGFDKLKTDVLPALNSTATAINKIFGRDDLTLDDKITLSRQAARKRLGPLADAIGDVVGDVDWGQEVGDALNYAAPKIAAAAGDVAPHAASAFVKAWLASGAWVQLFSAAWLAKKLGAFNGIGALAGRKFSAGFRRSGAPPVAGSPVVAPATRSPAGVPAAGGGLPLVPIGMGGQLADDDPVSQKLNEQVRRKHGPRPLPIPSGFDTFGGLRVRAVRPSAKAAQTLEITSVVQLPNGRELARTVKRVNAEEKARR